MSAGIPTISNLSGNFVYISSIQTIPLSGSQSVVLRLTDHIVEHQIPAREGGTTERIGSVVDKLEIRGIIYESGADAFLSQLSGLYNRPQWLSVPSFNSGFYFIQSGTPFLLESFGAHYIAGYGYPFYEWTAKGTLWVSGFWAIGQIGTKSGTSILIVNSEMTGVSYSQNLGQLIALFGDYVGPVSGNHLSGGNGY